MQPPMTQVLQGTRYINRYGTRTPTSKVLPGTKEFSNPNGKRIREPQVAKRSTAPKAKSSRTEYDQHDVHSHPQHPQHAPNRASKDGRDEQESIIEKIESENPKAPLGSPSNSETANDVDPNGLWPNGHKTQRVMFDYFKRAIKRARRTTPLQESNHNLPNGANLLIQLTGAERPVQLKKDHFSGVIRKRTMMDDMYDRVKEEDPEKFRQYSKNYHNARMNSNANQGDDEDDADEEEDTTDEVKKESKED
ncbi:Uu.00g126830.m01.CDS01 [Anthostomella pinea]|uniref:Uu.00g126830.m01.CDS01 n=1 Tax=Anthostomella pinea TaxID=933095 RepID=A0AAI8VJ39_9PEZI|nr:Uu.00g126830.m01.CDS01 [Anthostomella pinea]